MCYLFKIEPVLAKFRVNPSEIIGKHLTEIFPPDVASRNLSAVQLVINSKSPSYNDVELKFPFENIWVTSRLSPILTRNIMLSLSWDYQIDITKRKLAEMELLKLSPRGWIWSGYGCNYKHGLVISNMSIKVLWSHRLFKRKSLW